MFAATEFYLLGQLLNRARQTITRQIVRIGKGVTRREVVVAKGQSATSMDMMLSRKGCCAERVEKFKGID